MRPYLVCALLLIGSCSNDPGSSTTYGQKSGSLEAYCTANVIGSGMVNVETDYLAGVVRCENGNAPLEALKAQAVAARSYLYYKLNTSGSIADNQSDQVYSCGVPPSAIHYQAVQETSGQVLRYNNVQVAAFYVAGAIPSTSDCIAHPNDNDYSNTEHYVTYNWGKSGNAVTQTTLGWVNSGNYANRGCKSQNGATCLANKGWNYQDILTYYYGMDIELVYAEGSCIEGSCECSAGDKQTEACGQCGTKTRACNGCTWGPWSSCTGEGGCAPGDTDSTSCGACGSKSRTCTSECTWGSWGTCSNTGVCSPGEMQADTCGNCGTRTRSCSNQCAWNNWSSCGGQGVCAPGQVGDEPCGNCGSRSRTCTNQCAWPAWSSCKNEGVCAPGAQDSAACGDCGLITRQCDSSCQWGSYGECESLSDAPGNSCASGLPGPCSNGVWACVDGESTCQSSVLPSPDICDGIDNDCNGIIDDGGADLAEGTLYAAKLVAVDAPAVLAPGQLGSVDVTFENEGAADWPSGTMWVIADGNGGQEGSLLHDGFTWSTSTVVLTIPQSVASGEAVSLSIPIRAPNRPGATITETFRLAEQNSGLLSCTSPFVTVTVTISNAIDADNDPNNRADDVEDEQTKFDENSTAGIDRQEASSLVNGESSDGCAYYSLAPTSSTSSFWLLLLALMLFKSESLRRFSND